MLLSLLVKKCITFAVIGIFRRDLVMKFFKIFSRDCSALFELLTIAKMLVRRDMIYEYIETPIKTNMIVMSTSVSFVGVISPYPTVLIVTMAQ